MSMQSIKTNSLVKRCISALVYGVGGAAGSRVFMALANVILSRILGQALYGQFANLNATVNLFITFSGLGLSATLTRYVSAKRDDPAETGRYIGTLYPVCFAMSLLLSAVMFLFSRQISVLSTGEDALTAYFRLVAIVVFFAGMSSIEQSIMVGLESFRKSALIQLLRCALFCVLSYFFSLRWQLYGSIYALLVVHGLQYLVSVIVNRRDYRKRQITLARRWDAGIRQAVTGFALPAFVSSIFVLPVNWLGNAILTRTSGFEAMAVFSVAHQWMTYITYIPSQMGQMRPIYTDLFQKGQMATLRRLISRVTLSTTALAAFVALCAYLFVGGILGIYGDGYLAGRATFGLMLAAAVAYTAQVQTGFFIQASGKMWLGLVINLVWGVVLLSILAANAAAGAQAYAAAYCAAYAVTFVLQLWVMIHHLRGAQDNDCE